MLTLKIKVILPAKKGHFKNSRELPSGTSETTGKSENKERPTVSKGKGQWGEPGAPVPWLLAGKLWHSLAGPSPDRGWQEPFLVCWGAKKLKQCGVCLPVGSEIYQEWRA